MPRNDTVFDGMVGEFDKDEFLGSGPWMVPDPEPAEGVDDE